MFDWIRNCGCTLLTVAWLHSKQQPRSEIQLLRRMTGSFRLFLVLLFFLSYPTLRPQTPVGHHRIAPKTIYRDKENRLIHTKNVLDFFNTTVARRLETIRRDWGNGIRTGLNLHFPHEHHSDILYVYSMCGKAPTRFWNYGCNQKLK